eukprot:IDg9833t1
MSKGNSKVVRLLRKLYSDTDPRHPFAMSKRSEQANTVSQRKRGASFGVDGPEYDADVIDGVSADAAGYDMSISAYAPIDDDADDEAEAAILLRKTAAPGANLTAPQALLDEAARAASAADPHADDPFRKFRAPNIAERESSYMARRHNRKPLLKNPVKSEEVTGEPDTKSVNPAIKPVSVMAAALRVDITSTDPPTSGATL